MVDNDRSNLENSQFITETKTPISLLFDKDGLSEGQ